MSTLNTYNLKSPDSANTNLALDASGNVAIQAGSASAPSIYVTGDTNTGLYSPGADQIAVTTGGTARLFIDSSGRLLVGTTTSNGAQLEVNRPQSVATGLSALLSSPQFSITNSSNWGFPVGAVFKTPLANGGAIVDNAAIWAEFESTNNAYLGFATRSSGTVAERVRIDSSGRLLVGTSSASGNAVIQTNTSVTSARFAGNTIYDYPIVEIKSGRAGSGFPGTFIDFKRDTEVSIGSINGSTASVSYNTTSDYRLKENVVPVADGIARLQQLKPCRFNFIIDPAVTIDGFIAHEAQAVVPECVTGEKDAVDADGNPIYQGIDQSKLVPLLTAALQEAVGRIETLEAEVAALKAQ